MSNPVQLYVAGEVRRWHANPAIARFGQTNADHQGRCVQLLLILHPEASPALIRAVAFHDVGELYAGDVPGPFKDANPACAAEHARFEEDARAAICGAFPYLTPVEAKWLWMIDRLEAAAFVCLNNRAEALRQRAGWGKARNAVITLASELGVGPEVAKLLGDLIKGDW